ncbi:hypothetical protein [Micromonospora sp. NBC_01813]|uniref:hypothetical protein n=1 Tax=Micromonospora sp. NBC_01813 TaxID=2975988 RepID=UPI002DDA8BB6|nr:hypothetical protein [Micromonospora sp. NBC_01813]WSA08089.1 hypothetical protein OG958_28405 [Micromonospora sp. NBC_01813]
MRTRKALIVAAAAAAIVGLSAAPAVAQDTGDTTTTFDVDAGTLDITVPATADLGNGDAGTTITGQLGAVTVDDTRAAADASWEAEVEATDFETDDGGDASEIVTPGNIDYWSGAATATTGNGTFTPGQANAGAALPLSDVTPITAFTHAGGTGNNSASWNPTLEVNVPLANVAGTYTGTVTHSVA